MGIYDREYYRKEGPSFLDHITGQVCKRLVLINVAIWFVQYVTASQRPDSADLGWITNTFAMEPAKALQDLQIWRLLTGCFLHDPNLPYHIFWNMLFLWFFGVEMEDLYGRREFLLFYLAAGIMGNLLWGLLELNAGPVLAAGDRPPYNVCLGASGAVTGVMMLYTLHYPFRTILVGLFLPVQMWLVTLFSVGTDVLILMRGHGANGVAVAAHVGGALFALAYWQFEWRLAGAWLNFKRRARRAPALKAYREDREVLPAPVAVAPPEPLDEQLEAKVDVVLEKVHRSGRASLTAEENALLQRASEVYRRRRS